MKRVANSASRPGIKPSRQHKKPSTPVNVWRTSLVLKDNSMVLKDTVTKPFKLSIKPLSLAALKTAVHAKAPFFLETVTIMRSHLAELIAELERLREDNKRLRLQPKKAKK